MFRRCVKLLVLSITLLLALASTAGARSQLQLGDSGKSVQKLNDRLYDLNYLPQHKGNLYDAQTRDAVIAFQKWRRLDRDGVAGLQTRKKLKHAHQPSALVQKSGKYMVISLRKQVLQEINNGEVKWTIHISTAMPGYSTPKGSFSIFRKERQSWSVPYSVWLPWASYFTGGISFHGYPEVPVYPASHGCVRMPMKFASRVYRFAAMGTPVYVIS